MCEYLTFSLSRPNLPINHSDPSMEIPPARTRIYERKRRRQLEQKTNLIAKSKFNFLVQIPLLHLIKTFVTNSAVQDKFRRVIRRSRGRAFVTASNQGVIKSKRMPWIVQRSILVICEKKASYEFLFP